MSFYLYILRHAKSDWTANEPDVSRPLNKRGRQNAVRMGQWLVANEYIPEQVLCSTAARAKQTLALVANEIGTYKDENIIYDPQLYLADLQTLLEKILLYRHAAGSLLLVGHNPGLDDLVDLLSGKRLERNDAGKLMTTAALAIFEYPADDFAPGSETPQNMRLVRPRELDQDVTFSATT